MKRIVSNSDESNNSLSPARLTIAAAAAALLLLAGLHVLSPEYDPAWRMVSEYANGHYGLVLSLMFAAWALSSWAVAFTIWRQVKTTPGKIGLVLLTIAGVGEAMAAVFDLNHDPFHSIAGALGILGLPIAAMLISVTLGRTPPWSAAKRALFWTANLTWVSLALLAATFALFIVTYVQAGGDLNAPAPKVVPPGVIAWVGWANRLLVVFYCAWVITVAWYAIKLHASEIEASNYRTAT